MSRGLGRIERAILGAMEARRNGGYASYEAHRWVDGRKVKYPVDAPVEGWWLAAMIFRTGSGSEAAEPTPAQMKSVIRAMHSISRRFPQYVLCREDYGRRRLAMTEPGVPIVKHRNAPGCSVSKRPHYI